jgi:hypothetical protein
MMSTTVILILAEVFVVLLGIVGFLFYLRWKRKKDKSTEIEELLDNIDSQQAERKLLLSEHLKENCDMQNEQAEESCGLMIEAEKQFLQLFLKQQIEQTPMTDFYTNLCELLDQYLYFIIPVQTEQNLSTDETPLVIAETIKPVKDETVENKAAEDEFDIGNEFDIGDEFGTGEEITVAEEAEPETEVAGPETEETEPEEEPDWGDAFAESGDEIDESTKDGYEADLKKE